VANVADDGDAQTLDATFVLAHGQRIEQTLRRMRVTACPARQHADPIADVPRHEIGDRGVGVAQHEGIDLHRLQRGYGIEDALALESRRQLHFDVDYIGAEPMRSEFERDTRACRGFGEHHGYGFAGKPGAACRGSRCGSRKMLGAFE
jgi:hypothetical protein